MRQFFVAVKIKYNERTTADQEQSQSQQPKCNEITTRQRGRLRRAIPRKHCRPQKMAAFGDLALETAQRQRALTSRRQRAPTLRRENHRSRTSRVQTECELLTYCKRWPLLTPHNLCPRNDIKAQRLTHW
jgi:hypothetical protein